MDLDDIGEFIVILICLFFIIVMVYVIIIFGYLNPIRSDKAQTSCVNSGFETFIYFRSKIFTTDILALYCGTYEQRMIREQKIDAYQNTGDEKGTFIIKSNQG